MPPKPNSKPPKQKPTGTNNTKNTKNQNKNPNTTPTQPSRPSWPPLRPLPHPSSLTLTPQIRDQIYLVHNLLPAALCKTYVRFLSSLPLATTPVRPKRGEAVRVNDRFQVEDAGFAEMLWSGTGLREVVLGFLEGDGEEEGEGDDGDDDGAKEIRRKRNAKQLFGGEPLGLNSNIRIYRYSAGQFFGKHYDDSSTLSFTPPKSTHPIPARTSWTLLIYLSSCDGGETIFYPDPTRENRKPEPVAFPPEMGLALLHRHGERCLLHEGGEVTGGEKWVLRSDLVVARA